MISYIRGQRQHILRLEHTIKRSLGELLSLSSRHRQGDSYARTMAMRCSESDARAICDRVAHAHAYRGEELGPTAVRYEPRVEGSPEPGIDVSFRESDGETIVIISGNRRPSRRRARSNRVSIRSQVVIFRDHLWCDATSDGVKARLS